MVARPRPVHRGERKSMMEDAGTSQHRYPSTQIAPTTLRISPMQPSRWRGRAAATFGTERAAGEGSTHVRTNKAKRCSARRRRTGHEEQGLAPATSRSEEHTSELQSLMRISYAVFCMKKQKKD